MPRTCTICTHSRGQEIDKALISRQAYRAISRQFEVGRESLRRHAEEHLPKLLLKAYEAEEQAAADSLLSEAKDLHHRTLTILERAESKEEDATALRAVREARGNLELLGKLSQLIQTAPQVNLQLSSEWVELRTLIVTALEEHPQAKTDVLRAIESAGSSGAA